MKLCTEPPVVFTSISCSNTNRLCGIFRRLRKAAAVTQQIVVQIDGYRCKNNTNGHIKDSCAVKFTTEYVATGALLCLLRYTMRVF
jgi:hypothetical protein